MLHYAVVFFVIALIAAFFGFGGIAVGAASIAKILFVVFFDRRGDHVPDEPRPPGLAQVGPNFSLGVAYGIGIIRGAQRR